MGKAITNRALNVESSWYMTNLWLVLAGLVVVVAVGLVCPRWASCLTPWGLSDFCAPLPRLAELYRQQGHIVPCNTHTHTHTHIHTHNTHTHMLKQHIQILPFNQTHITDTSNPSPYIPLIQFSQVCTHSLSSCHTLFVLCISFF